ncbi:MAG: lytic transglycosylase domain-containing protein [Burkholderiales bacterium]|nr:lytic transglycosylase domain-containing protein [Burkholderiales bacterium]
MRLVDLKDVVRKGGEALVAVVRNGLAGFGVLVLLFLAIGAPNPWPAEATAASVQNPVVQEGLGVPAQPVFVETGGARQRALAAYLSRKYRVSGDATEGLVVEAFHAGRRTGLDPLLILAVMAVESSLNPIAESEYGAKGLMQVVPRFHLDKLAYHGGEGSVLDPRTNIRVGAEILRDYIQRAGDLRTGLQMYAGAVEDAASQYAQRVLAEKSRLGQAASSPTGRRVATGPDA